uniref:Uncharacterized protein n=1 Tax=Knipowitschia caucasica TaxID=637954 RepID=A0AAV2JL84_KNICA
MAESVVLSLYHALGLCLRKLITEAPGLLSSPPLHFNSGDTEAGVGQVLSPAGLELHSYPSVPGTPRRVRPGLK